jgi:hypothetical protein
MGIGLTLNLSCSVITAQSVLIMCGRIPRRAAPAEYVSGQSSGVHLKSEEVAKLAAIECPKYPDPGVCPTTK